MKIHSNKYIIEAIVTKKKLQKALKINKKNSMVLNERVGPNKTVLVEKSLEN